MSNGWKVDLCRVDGTARTLLLTLGETRSADPKSYGSLVAKFAQLHVDARSSSGGPKSGSLDSVQFAMRTFTQLIQSADAYAAAVHRIFPPVRRNADAFFQLRDAAWQNVNSITQAWDKECIRGLHTVRGF